VFLRQKDKTNNMLTRTVKNGYTVLKDGR